MIGINPFTCKTAGLLIVTISSQATRATWICETANEERFRSAEPAEVLMCFPTQRYGELTRIIHHVRFPEFSDPPLLSTG